MTQVAQQYTMSKSQNLKISFYGVLMTSTSHSQRQQMQMQMQPRQWRGNAFLKNPSICGSRGPDAWLAVAMDGKETISHVCPHFVVIHKGT